MITLCTNLIFNVEYFFIKLKPRFSPLVDSGPFTLEQQA